VTGGDIGGSNICGSKTSRHGSNWDNYNQTIGDGVLCSRNGGTNLNRKSINCCSGGVGCSKIDGKKLASSEDTANSGSRGNDGNSGTIIGSDSCCRSIDCCRRVVCTVALLVALGDTEVLVAVIEAVGPVVSVKRMTINGQAGGEEVIDETKGVLW